ncbi:MAG TPA: ArdC-like ssDNA-binding domain-containing protein [Thermoanaerobaculia bacterium]|nr:ArdC-like ssDNA-binding domain-containing protein [Thermoanaerobaculia bacterium]
MSQRIYQLVTDRILDLLEQGVVPWKKPWSTTGKTVPPSNLVSLRPYRGINVFLLIAQHFGSPYWVTYKQALDLGGHVRQGERGTPIVFWRIDNETADDTEEEITPTRRRRILLRYYTVFNVDQCEGIEDQGDATFDARRGFDPIPACAAAYTNMPNPPKLRHGGERAFYLRSDDRVQLPKPEAFSSPHSYYSTLFHELAHSTGHPSRLDRFAEEDDAGGFGSPPYAREELVAEMTAAMLCGVLGIAPIKVEAISPSGTEELLESSAAYLRHWADVLKADHRAVVIAAARAQKAADYILGCKSQEQAVDESEAA